MSHCVRDVITYHNPCSISYQFIRQKSKLVFSALKMSYRMHNGLKTKSRVHRIMQWHKFATKLMNDVIITTSNILCKINYLISNQLSFPTAHNMYINIINSHTLSIAFIDIKVYPCSTSLLLLYAILQYRWSAHICVCIIWCHLVSEIW